MILSDERIEEIIYAVFAEATEPNYHEIDEAIRTAIRETALACAKICEDNQATFDQAHYLAEQIRKAAL